jgi:uncharacterized delta-60 repeat protein
MFARLDLIQAHPELAGFQFRASNHRTDGSRNRSTIKDIYADAGPNPVVGWLLGALATRGFILGRMLTACLARGRERRAQRSIFAGGSRVRRGVFVVALAVMALWAGAGQALAAAGELDPSYGGGSGKSLADFGGTDGATAVALQPDGKLVVAGFSSNGLSDDVAVARLLSPEGTFDPSYGGGSGKSLADFGSSAGATAVALQPDGKIVVAGYRSVGGASADFAVGRLLNPQGAFDPSYGGGSGKSLVDFGGFDGANAVALQPDGKIVVAGYSSAGGHSDFAVGRLLSPEGTLDLSYGGGSGKSVADLGGDDIGTAVALQPDGKIVVAGQSIVGGSSDFAVARLLNPQGTFDPSYGGGSGKSLTDFGGYDEAAAVALQPDGKMLVAGDSDARGTDDFAVMRRLPDGSPDESFGSGGKAFVDFGGSDGATAMALQPDGKIVLAGYSNARGTYDFAAARLLPGGSLDESFGSGGRAFVDFGGSDGASAMALQPDGKIVVAGASTNGGNSDFAVARLQGDAAGGSAGGGSAGGGSQAGGSQGGGTQGGGTQGGKPSVRGLRASPVVFRAADSGASIAARRGRKTGATISYLSSEAATTVFTVLSPSPGIRDKRHRCVKPSTRNSIRSSRRKRCTRLVAVGSFTTRT